MRVGNVAHRPRRQMDELRPCEIARHPVLLRPLLPHPRRGLVLNVRHRLRDRRPEGFENVLIAGERMQHGQAFRRVKVQVVSDHPLMVGSRRQPLAGPRMFVVHQRRKGVGRHVADETQKPGSLAVPLADNLLLLRIVVLAIQPFRIILAGCRGGLVSNYPQHWLIIPASPASFQRTAGNSHAPGKTCPQARVRAGVSACLHVRRRAGLQARRHGCGDAGGHGGGLARLRACMRAGMRGIMRAGPDKHSLNISSYIFP